MATLTCFPKGVSLDHNFCHKNHGANTFQYNPPSPVRVDVQGEAQEQKASGQVFVATSQESGTHSSHSDN